MGEAAQTQKQTKALPTRRARRVTMTLTQRRWIGRIISYSILLVGALVMIFPLFWMLSASLKPEWQILVRPTIWIPSEWQQKQAGTTAKDFPLWHVNHNGKQVEVIEIGTRRYTTAVDVSKIDQLYSVPADQLSNAKSKTYDDMIFNVRSWSGGEVQSVVALARDGDNLVVASLDTLRETAQRMPLDELNAGKRAKNQIGDYSFMGRELEPGSTYVQVGPETQRTVVGDKNIANSALLVAEDVPVNPVFMPVSGSELEVYSLQGHPEDEKYVVASVEAWQPIMDMDEALKYGFVVSNTQFQGERETRRINDGDMTVDTVKLDDNSTQEVLVLVERTTHSFVIPVDKASTLRLAPVSKGLGEPFVKTVDSVPVRYVDDYDQDGKKIKVVILGERDNRALVIPLTALSAAFDVNSKSLERVLTPRLRYENYQEVMAKDLGGATS